MGKDNGHKQRGHRITDLINSPGHSQSPEPQAYRQPATSSAPSSSQTVQQPYPAPDPYQYQQYSSGQQYSGQQYSGQQYSGQQYGGQQYGGQQYGGQQYSGQQYSDQQFAGSYPDSTQHETGEKRTRESSSSSGGGHHHKKHHHESHGSSHQPSHGGHHHHRHRHHQQSQPSSANDPPPAPLPPMQLTSSQPASGSGGGNPPQSQGGARFYGDDVEVSQYRYEPLAGLQQGGPSSSAYASGAGRGSVPQQQIPVEWVDPGERPARRPRQPDPSAGGAGIVGGPYIPPFTIDGITWRGDIFDVDPPAKNSRWTPQQVRQAEVLMASFPTWTELERMGQKYPGNKTGHAVADKMVKDTRRLGGWQRWTRDKEDVEIRAMGAPPGPEAGGIDATSEEFCSRTGRSRAEVYGRRKMFARTGWLENSIGNSPTYGISVAVPPTPR